MKAPAIVWLRIEGLAAFGLAITLYYHFRLPWFWFAVLFLTPDLSMLGYLASNRVGAVVYNLAHTYAVALAVFALGITLKDGSATAAGLILCGHIGFDRALGYGLKLPGGFSDTHLGRIGRDKAQPVSTE